MFKREALWMLLAPFVMVALAAELAVALPSLLHWLRHQRPSA
jgi:hypothetical protein